MNFNVHLRRARRHPATVLQLVLFLVVALPAVSQISPDQIRAPLAEELLSPQVSLYQVRCHVLDRVAKPPSPASAAEWTPEAKRLRKHLLNDVIFHGWPRDVVTSPPKFEEVGVIETGKGYRIRKFRYEIVPGFQSTALLYEPEKTYSGMPAILNVNGHVGALGKAVEYKQKRCINFAKHGILALNLEWLSFGELSAKGNRHGFGAHLDLVGRQEVGLFYLAMRRGLDFLDRHPLVDRERLGMTGLSGGGWQTIMLSSLDERIKVAVPVAGFSSIASRIEAKRYGDLGDVEQAATDFLAGQDFPHLVALRAPRPTLLIYNAKDDCCFRAPLVKPLVFDAIRPIFRLFGAEEALQWHENMEPGTHNYQLDNRVHAYRFFSKYFNLPDFSDEGDLDPEVKSYDDLVVGLPTNNLTILGLAQKLGREITREPLPVDAVGRKAWIVAARRRLREVTRYEPVHVTRLWPVAGATDRGLETVSYVFEMSDGLCANGVWLRTNGCPDSAPVTIILNDQGKQETATDVSMRINQGEQVLAVDLPFIGDAWKGIHADQYEQIICGLGERPLGMVAAQLAELARWSSSRTDAARVRVECHGLRTQTIALVAAALEPGLFSEIVVREGIPSLTYVLEKPVSFSEAPELFCLDLLKYFDLDRLGVMADIPVRIETLVAGAR